MSICENCNAQLSCGCQKRTASDGKKCCDQCIKLYEEKLLAQSPNTPVNNNG
jgi:hypothetical protein